MDRRFVGIALVLSAAAMFGLLFAQAPPPENFEQWVCCEGDADTHLLVARGPILAVYDQPTDTTYAVFGCGHAYCHVAASIDGDARDALAKSNVVLFSSERPVPRGLTPMPAPIHTEGQLAPPEDVTNATTARFEVGRAWLPLALYQGALVLAVVGIALGFGLELVGLSAAAIGGAAGIFVGALRSALSDDIVTPLLVILATGLGVSAAVAARWWPRARPYAAFALAFAFALALGGMIAGQYFAPYPTR